MPSTVRAVYAYELHGHDGEEPLDYRSFFEAIIAIPAIERQDTIERTREIVAIPEVRRLGPGQFALRFITGREGDVALFYDLTSGAEREELPRETEIAAQTSWLLIDSLQRVVVQERRRPGVPMAMALGAILAIARERQLAVNPTMTLHPLVGESFLDELGDLEIIKSATLVLKRPNMSWRGNANYLIENSADNSNAGSYELTVKSKPGESLSKDEGVVPELAAMVSDDFGPLEDAKVRGRRAGEVSDHTVTTKNHALRREILLPDSATYGQEQEALLNGASAYLNELAEGRKPDNMQITDDGQ